MRRRYPRRRSGATGRPGASPRTRSAPPPRLSPPRPPARLTEGVTPADLAEADIYPTVVWERGEPLDEVTAHYEALAVFLRAAARDGDGVLLWIS
ncbi:DUF1877 family protein [Streptomyces pseudogriseolus]|uniref:DUF1877 family protein n=1 Tax=Streptomyces pseudogriseolus TaxID=36817 RepID=UPI003FA253B3